MAERVGLLTLPLFANYGGITQAAALYRFLESHDKEPVFLQKRPVRSLQHRACATVLSKVPGQNIGGVRSRSEVRAVHRPFIERYMPRRSRPVRTSTELAREARRLELDAVIVGSDQVWRFDYHVDGGAAAMAYFLDFVDPDVVRRIAYAASFGRSEWVNPEWTQEASRLLSDFHTVSVRETSGASICQDSLGCPHARVVVDPTLLVDPSFYAEIGSPAPAFDEPTLVIYVLDRSESVRRTVEATLKHLQHEGLATVEISPEDPTARLDVPSWIKAFRDAEFIVTDSFHGTVLSVLFRKRFIAVPNRDRGLDRFTSLLESLGLVERLASDDGSSSLEAILDSPIDHDVVDLRLDRLRRDSTEFLLSSLA